MLPTTSLQVRKRNGSTLPFDKSKIASALSRAGTPLDRVGAATEATINIVISRAAAPTFDVEDIQNAAEVALLSLGLRDVAQAFMSFRDEKAIRRRSRPVRDDVRAAFAESAAYFETPLQQFQFYDKYSRFNYALGRRETWVETVDRVVDYLCELALQGDECVEGVGPTPDYLLPDRPMATFASPPTSRQDVVAWLRATGRQMILGMEAMPSMRLIAMAGEPARRQNLSLFNCAYVPVDSPQAWVEMLILSMAGCGVGFSVERKYVDKLPMVPAQTGERLYHKVADTSEGWAEALVFLFAALFSGRDVDFDVSELRPAGSPLKTKGGRASGPEPFLRMIRGIREVVLARQRAALRDVDAHDVSCLVGEAAVQGGMRRTAMLSLSDHDSTEMARAKHGKYPEFRWNANNSAVWPESGVDDLTVLRHFVEMDEGKAGERGIFSREAVMATMPERRRDVWPAGEHAGVNPCQPSFATVLTPDGVRTFADIDVGSTIWSGKQWTKVVRKLATGIKPVVLYNTKGGHFIGTEDHIVLSYGERVMVKNAEAIDLAFWPSDLGYPGIKWDRVYHDNPDGDTVGYVSESIPLGDHPVYDITVDADEHTYWTGGLLVSNCGEIYLRPRGLCNLSIAVARAGDDAETLLRKVEAAAVFGTIQSLATTYPGLRPEWQENARRERLLGVDVNGQRDCVIINEDADGSLQRRLRNAVVETNVVVAAALGVNPSLATTCVKPSGNSSTLLNCNPGLHPRHSRYYVRNVRVSAHGSVFKLLRDAGAPLSPENGQTAATATTWVCAFPCKAPDGAVVKGETSALQQLGYWLSSKLNYTEHNPSVTITYRPDELVDVTAWVARHRSVVGGLSFLPASGAAYEQMPYVEISATEYERRAAAFPTVDWSKLAYYEDEDLTTAAQEIACSAGACLI